MFVAIMMLIIMIFVAQVMGFEYLRIKIKEAVLQSRNEDEYAEGYDAGYNIGYDLGYAEGYREGHTKGYHSKFYVEEYWTEDEFKVTEEGHIPARKKNKDRT